MDAASRLPACPNPVSEQPRGTRALVGRLRPAGPSPVAPAGATAPTSGATPRMTVRCRVPAIPESETPRPPQQGPRQGEQRDGDDAGAQRRHCQQDETEPRPGHDVPRSQAGHANGQHHRGHNADQGRPEDDHPERDGHVRDQPGRRRRPHRPGPWLQTQYRHDQAQDDGRHHRRARQAREAGPRGGAGAAGYTRRPVPPQVRDLDSTAVERGTSAAASGAVPARRHAGRSQTAAPRSVGTGARSWVIVAPCAQTRSRTGVPRRATGSGSAQPATARGRVRQDDGAHTAQPASAAAGSGRSPVTR